MLEKPPFQERQMPGAQQQPAMGAEDEVPEEDASPEEQALRTELMKYCYKLMADEKAFPALQKMIQSDPVNAIADATVTIIKRLEKDKGEQDTDLLQSLAGEIVEQFGELAEADGIDIPEEDLEKAVALAIGKWSQEHPDRVDQAGMQAMGDVTTQALGGAQQPAQQQQPAAQAAPEVMNG